MTQRRMDEQARIDFLLHRDGREACIRWVRRTIGIYRRAVLDRRHFAGSKEYRRLYIAAYRQFKRWLEHQPAVRPSGAQPRGAPHAHRPLPG